LKALTVLTVQFPSYLDSWTRFGRSIPLPYFDLLFQYLADQPDYSEPHLMERRDSLVRSAVLPLLGQNGLSAEWFSLATSIVPFFEGFPNFYSFLDDFQEVLKRQELFSPFFGFFLASIFIGQAGISRSTGRRLRSAIDGNFVWNLRNCGSN
jgi:hypothetical protein